MRGSSFLRRRLGIAFVLLSFIVSVAIAQREAGSRFDLPEDDTAPGSREMVPPAGLALEGTIDPEKYFVGPSDVFSINIWTSPPLNYTTTVTPEGTLIVPTVGEVRVADLTLKEAKESVLAKIRTKYRTTGDEVGVTLVSPRPIVVWIRGNVLNPGSYQLWAFNRADKVVEEANRLQGGQTQRDLDLVVTTMSTRNITIKHKDGSAVAVDISKFLATKDETWNPYLREGDLVIVPRKDLERGVIGVYGEVNVPGRFEYVRGDSVKDALGLAQGFTSEAITDSIEFFRIDVERDSMMSAIFDGDSLLSGLIEDRPLEPGDRLVVRARQDMRGDLTAAIDGEVRFPGTYPITRDRTRLTEIVEKAGGFTEFASIRTSEVIRRSVRRQDIGLERLLSYRGGVRSEDSLYYNLETDLRLQKEIVNVDFYSLFVLGDSTHDIFLQDRDVVRIPTRKVTIYVFGQVSSPGHIPFVVEGDVDYYIRRAGGYTDRARPDDVRIVKAKTRQWLSPLETKVEEGDYIWVPKETERSFAYYMAIIGQTAAIISVALSIVLISIQIGQN